MSVRGERKASQCARPHLRLCNLHPRARTISSFLLARFSLSASCSPRIITSLCRGVLGATHKFVRLARIRASTRSCEPRDARARIHSHWDRHASIFSSPFCSSFFHFSFFIKRDSSASFRPARRHDRHLGLRPITSGIVCPGGILRYVFVKYSRTAYTEQRTRARTKKVDYILWH